MRLDPLGLKEIPLIVGLRREQNGFRVRAMRLNGHDRQEHRQQRSLNADLLADRVLLRSFMLMVHLELRHAFSLINSPGPRPAPATRPSPDTVRAMRSAPHVDRASP